MIDWLFRKPLAVGSIAPDFTLPDESGVSHHLAGLRGRNVVLVFYPADETTVCRKQLCEFRDEWAGVQAANAAVFGVNPANAESHARFKQNRSFPFPLLVDRGQRVARLYRASGWMVRRTVYRIGPDGVIRFARRGKPAPAEVLAAATIK